MKLTRIHQIEITSRCNLRCKYCPHPELKRAKMDMDYRTFSSALAWVHYFDKQGTQPELAFTGMGEALMHPEFLSFIMTARVIYKGNIHFSTNGIMFDERIAAFCKEYNVGVYISLHRPELAAPAVNLAKKYNVLRGTNASFAYSSLDFAGAVDWPNSAPKQYCMYQKEAWGMVLADGSINTCCWEAEGENIIGHVDDEIGSVDMKVMPACSRCDLVIESGEQQRRAVL